MEYTERNFNRTILACAIVAFALVLLFASCKSASKIARKHIARIEQADNKAKRKGCDTCGLHYFATKYPVKVAQGKTVYIPGKTRIVEKTDTLERVVTGKADTIIRTITKWRTEYRHDTIQIRDTVINTAEIGLLQAKINGLEQSNTKYRDAALSAQNSRNTLIWWLFIVAVVAFLVGRFIRK